VLERPPRHVDHKPLQGVEFNDDLRDGLGHARYIVPGLAADIELAGPEMIQAVLGGGEGDEGAFIAVSSVVPAQDAHHAVERTADRKLQADDIECAKNFQGQKPAQDTDALPLLYLVCPEKATAYDLAGDDVPVELVDANQGIACEFLLVPGRVAGREGDEAGRGHARRLADGLGDLEVELLGRRDPLVGRKPLFERALDDRGAAQQFEVLVQVELDLLAHGQDHDNTGRAESYGQHNAEIAAILPCHLQHTDKQQVAVAKKCGKRTVCHKPKFSFVYVLPRGRGALAHFNVKICY